MVVNYWGIIAPLMVRSAVLRVSNHEAPMLAASFETPLTRLLRMRGKGDLALPKNASQAAFSRPRSKITTGCDFSVLLSLSGVQRLTSN